LATGVPLFWDSCAFLRQNIFVFGFLRRVQSARAKSRSYQFNRRKIFFEPVLVAGGNLPAHDFRMRCMISS
jgi:hypothetical protein